MFNRETLLIANPAAFVRHILETYKLPTSRLQKSSGLVNNVWLTPTHVVRISSGRYRDSYAYESRILQLLPPEVPHPQLLAYGRVGTREWMIQRRVAGVPLHYIWARLSRPQQRDTIAQLGCALRMLHTLSLPEELSIPPWLADALTTGKTPENVCSVPPAHYPVLLKAAQHIPYADTSLLNEIDAFIAERLNAFRNDLAVLLHNDIHFANLIWHDGRLTALIDFEFALLAAPDYELNTLLGFVRVPELYLPPGHQDKLIAHDLAPIPSWLANFYPALFAHPRLYERLEVYDALINLCLIHDIPPDENPLNPWKRLRSLLNEKLESPLLF